MTTDSEERTRRRQPYHLVFGQNRFSDQHAWAEVTGYFPASLRDRITIETVEQGRLGDRLRGGVPNVDVVIPVMSPLTAADLESHRIRLIQQFGAGYEAIDVDAADKRGIFVANMPGLGAVHVAEHAMALLLSLARRLPEARKGFQVGEWGSTGGTTLAGLTACIVGMGAIGTEIACRLLAFNVNVLGTYRSNAAQDMTPDRVELHPASELEAIAGRVDILIIAASHARSAPPVVSRSVLQRLRRGAIVINISRGSVLDNNAALELLSSGTLRALGLDVFPIEPYPADGPLLRDSRVMATSHTAALTSGFFADASRVLGEAIVAIDRGEAPRNRVLAPSLIA